MHIMDSPWVPRLYKYIIYLRSKHYYSITVLALREVSSCLDLIAQDDCD